MLCPVNLPNEEKLAGREKLARGGSQDKEKLLTNASSPLLRRWKCNSKFGVRLPEAYTILVVLLFDFSKKQTAKAQSLLVLVLRL